MDGRPSPARPPKLKTINAVDLFCGAGGTSTGLIEAVNSLGYAIKLTAINHWDVAIATHSKNHEDVEHYCQSIEALNPTDVIPGGRLQLLVASPECTHHSRARGGKPRSDQKRADAWLLMRWIEKLYVENILIENVKEFIEWGPLTAAGIPDKRHKGMYFKQFIEALRINYSVDWTVLNCADYGDPTTRERFFLIAKRGRKTIIWPKPTHASRKRLAQLEKEGITDHGLKPWVPAREIIDWNLEGKSIFGRKKPLSDNTMRRIFAGLTKYSLKPFIVPQFSGHPPRDVDRPLGTVTTTSRGVGVVDPFLVNLKNADRRDRSIDEPTFTQNTGNHQAVVEPFVISAGGPKLHAKTVGEPLRTVLTRDHQAVVEPFIVSAAHGGNTNPPRDIDEPLGSVLGSPKFGVVEPFILGQQSGSVARVVSEPIPTVVGKGAIGLVESDVIEADPFILNMRGDHPQNRSIDEPMPTLVTGDHKYIVDPFLLNMKKTHQARALEEPTFTQTTKDHQFLVEPYLVKYYGNGDNADSVHDPLATVTGRDRFGLVDVQVLSRDGRPGPEDGETGLCIPELGVVIFVRFRMLQPHELAAAMSFPADYEFAGTREDKVKQIGNAVPRKTAAALARAILVN